MAQIYSAVFLAACTFWTIAPSLAAENSLEVDLGQDVKLQFVLIKAGKFTQGSPRNEAGRNDDETQRTVTITKDYFLGKYPVTVAQFRRFADETGYRTEAEQGPSGGFGFDGKALAQRKEFTWRNPGYPQSDDRPVTIVTYDDAKAFANWLTQKAGRSVPLPTEAQWEYACRAGTKSRYYSGDSETDLKAIGWYRANSDNAAQPVGQKRPNTFGLYDMSGNVYQWCLDWYGPYGDNATDPQETRSDRTSPPRRVLRGGSWLKDARQCRSAARFRNTPGSRNADNGFRVAAEVTVAEQPEAQSSLLLDRCPDPPPTRADFGGLFFVIILVAIVMMLVRAFQNSGSLGGPSRPGTPPFQPRDPRWLAGGMAAGMRLPMEPAADGFWINTSGLPVGSIVHYRYQVLGAPHQSTLVVEPGGRQFVYTGNTPDQVDVIHVDRADAGTSFTPDIMPNISPSQPHSSSQSTPQASDSSGSSFGGFPSAY